MEEEVETARFLEIFAKSGRYNNRTFFRDQRNEEFIKEQSDAARRALKIFLAKRKTKRVSNH